MNASLDPMMDAVQECDLATAVKFINDLISDGIPEQIAAAYAVNNSDVLDETSCDVQFNELIKAGAVFNYDRARKIAIWRMFKLHTQGTV